MLRQKRKKKKGQFEAPFTLFVSSPCLAGVVFDLSLHGISKKQFACLSCFRLRREPTPRDRQTMSQADASLTLGDAALTEDLKPDYSGVPSQALDAVRMRLAQLTHSLRRIRDELSKAEQAQWYTLQSQLNVTLTQLMSVTSTLQHFQGTLDSTVVYPLPNFPTTSHENLLTTLLRKRHAPEIDEWISLAKDTSGIDQKSQDSKEIIKQLNEDKDIARWALNTLVQEFERYDFKSLYSAYNLENIADVENVRTYKPSKPFMVDDILKYTCRGEGIKETSQQESVDINMTGQ